MRPIALFPSASDSRLYHAHIAAATHESLSVGSTSTSKRRKKFVSRRTVSLQVKDLVIKLEQTCLAVLRRHVPAEKSCVSRPVFRLPNRLLLQLFCGSWSDGASLTGRLSSSAANTAPRRHDQTLCIAAARRAYAPAAATRSSVQVPNREALHF